MQYRYLAYDFDIEKTKMADICPDAAPGSSIALKGWKLAFDKSGLATLLEASGSQVYVKEWMLNQKSAAELHIFKRRQNMIYREIDLISRSIPTFIYLRPLAKYSLPSIKYINRLSACAIEAQFPKEYVEELNKRKLKIGSTLRARIMDGYRLSLGGIHGPRHWLRVLDNGLQLSALTPDADPIIIEYFALLHDCRRENDDFDFGHGERAAAFVERLFNEGELNINKHQFNKLIDACAFHEQGGKSTDPTIGCCWDADRLDLSRIGIRPSNRYLSTSAARNPYLQRQAWVNGVIDGQDRRLATRWSVSM